MYRNVMLISPDTVKANGDINYNLDDNTIGASIRAVQFVYLQDVIGIDLVQKLQVLVYNKIKGFEDNIDDAENSHYKTLLEDFVKDAMTYKVCSEICVRNALKIRNAGVVQTNDTNVVNVSLKDVKYLTQTYDTYWNSAVNRMVEFLNNNKQSFPEYKVCGSELGDKYGRIGLWLG